jgi:hypothetical protein
MRILAIVRSIEIEVKEKRTADEGRPEGLKKKNAI